MKVSITTALGVLLSLTSALAIPIKERALETCTTYETTTVVIKSTITVYPSSTGNDATQAPASAYSPDYKKTMKHEYVTPSVTTLEVIVGTPTSSSSTSPSTSPSSSESLLTEMASSYFTSPSSSVGPTSPAPTPAPTPTPSSTSTPTPPSTSIPTPPSTSAPSISAPTPPSTSTPIPPSTSIPTPPSSESPYIQPTTESTTQALTTPSPPVPTPSSTIETTAVQPTPTPPVVKTSPSSGVTFTGDATFYNVEAGTGSCGQNHYNSEYVVAPSYLYMGTPSNPNSNPHCGEKIMCQLVRGGPVVSVTVVDTCMGCAAQDLDFSPDAFKAMGCAESEGRCKVNWYKA